MRPTVSALLPVSTLLLVASLGATHSLQAGVQASSFMTVSDKSVATFGAANVIDGDPKTIWVEGKEGPGIGESFTIDLPRATVKKVVITPGHGADERMFKKYAHLKEATFEFLSRDDSRTLKSVKTMNITFEDVFKAHEVAVPDTKLGEELFGGQLKVTIVSVYPGIDYKDNTAVSEVRVVMDEFPAQKEVTAVTSAMKGFEKENLVDGSAKTAWIAEKPGSGQQITINAPDYGLSAVVISSGTQKDPKKFKEYGRPKEITIEVDKQVVKYTLKDSPDAQRIDLPAVNGFTGSLYGLVKITIDSVYPGSHSLNAAIGEIEVMATNFSM